MKDNGNVIDALISVEFDFSVKQIESRKSFDFQ